MRSVVVERDGLRIAALDYGSDGEPLLLLHPNGFCAGLFDPLARRLTDRFRPIAVDLRGHGGTDAPTDGPAGFAFARMADDVWTVLDELGVTGLAALGESLGGGVAALVAAARPGAVRRLMLCEAIAFDLNGSAPRPAGAPGDGGNFMATIARKRRNVWPDRATVRESYGSRPPLDVLAPEVLDAYVRWGFVDRPDGQVELACSPEVEATIFEVSSDDQGARASWKQLDALAGAAVVLHGDASDLPDEWFAAQAARVGAEPVVVPGGHFFLQEDTARAEALVREHLA
ncbi:MAG: alpha/beta hydrolase [Acidimicrobiia bacterium]|jgi:pimeloyl-ACP methyl ester carboxylesterase|nr:alpha/beta hydrolase [Acidimicrobiia bacterium]